MSDHAPVVRRGNISNSISYAWHHSVLTYLYYFIYTVLLHNIKHFNLALAPCIGYHTVHRYLQE